MKSKNIIMAYKTQKFILVLLLLILVLFSSCNNKGNVYEFDFTHEWTWSEIINHTNDQETKEQIERIKKLISVEEAHTLFFYLSALEDPKDIKLLAEIQSVQDSLGGGFYGMAPVFPNNTDTIPVPYDFEKLISAGLFLAEFRKTIYEAIAKTEYPLVFYNSDLDENSEIINNSNIELVFDLSCVKQIIDAFDKRSLTLNDAIEISNLPGFRHMLEHRRKLGYIPEPLPTSEDLAQFILYASSKEPLNMIWKWLSPWNYFNLSDLYINRKNYKKIITELESGRKDVTDLVSNKIDRFVPKNFTFNDTLTVAVNWGIRSWATEHTLGTNIVQFKDNFDLLLRTISHESFHKIQLELCPLDPAFENSHEKSFEDIVDHTFPDNKDTRLYQALSYIFLEGTASYVGGMNAAEISGENVKTGADLLNDIYYKIYVENNPGAVDEILNKGLISNGPFYVLGYKMTEEIVKYSDPEDIRKLLLNGTLGFFDTFFEIDEGIGIDNETYIEFNKDIKNNIKGLNTYVQTNAEASDIIATVPRGFQPAPWFPKMHFI